MKSKSARLSIPGALAAAAALLFAAGCPDSDPVTGPALTATLTPTPTGPAPTATPTPTPPPPAVNISGSWSGTWDPVPPGCPDSSATALFEQNGSSVTGAISTPFACGFSNDAFVGTVIHHRVEGTLQGGTVEGEVFETTLRLRLNGQGNTLNGKFEFHR